MLKKIVLALPGLAILALVVAGIVLSPIHEKRIYAQVQASQPTGFYAIGTNAVTNAAIGSSFAVTNPASNFLMLVQGGPIYCNTSEQIAAQSTLQLAASTTYLIVWNCGTEQLYAKTAVTAPGGSVPLSSGGVAGQPGTFLQANQPTEIPIALVVCGNTNCGNTANGTITDQRPVGLFPGSGTPLNTSTFTNLPTTNVTDGTMLMCTSCTTLTTGSATCTTGASNVLAVRIGGAWRCY